MRCNTSTISHLEINLWIGDFTSSLKCQFLMYLITVWHFISKIYGQCVELVAVKLRIVFWRDSHYNTGLIVNTMPPWRCLAIIIAFRLNLYLSSLTQLTNVCVNKRNQKSRVMICGILFFTVKHFWISLWCDLSAAPNMSIFHALKLQSALQHICQLISIYENVPDSSN